MKHLKINLAIVALIVAFAATAFTTKDSSSARFVNRWYQYVSGNPQLAASYVQTSFTASDQQAEESCPAADPVCAAKFVEGASGQPTGSPITILLGEFTP